MGEDGDEGVICEAHEDKPLSLGLSTDTLVDLKENTRPSINQPVLSLNIEPVYSDFEVLDSSLSTTQIRKL